MAHIRAFDLVPPIHDCVHGKASAETQLGELHAYCTTCNKWWHRHNNYWFDGRDCEGKFCLAQEDFTSEGMECLAVYIPPRVQ